MTQIEILLYVTIFVFGFLFLEFAFGLFSGARRRAFLASNRRGRLLAQGRKTDEIIPLMTRNKMSVADTGVVKVRAASVFLAYVDRLIDQSGLRITTQRLFLIAGFIALASFVCLILFAELGWFFSFFLSLGGTCLGLWLFLLERKRARINKIAEQLPETLDMIVRSLQAGHPIRSAIALVAEEMPDPIGSEFGLVVDEMTYGLELDEAFDHLWERVNLQDLHYMIVAINIQSRTGGNLAEILQNLSAVVRDRFRLHKKVRALTAEGRLSAYVLASVPFFIAMVMFLNVPDYYNDAAKNPNFPTILATGAVFYIASVLIIFKIVRIRV